MVEKTEEPTSPEFEQFVKIRMEAMAPHLLGSAPSGAVGFDEDRERFREESRAAWNEKLSLGFTAAELASGEPVETNRGRPVRLPESKASQEEESEARQVLEELRSRALADNFDPPLMVHLQDAARGVFTSAPVSLRAAIKEARSVCASYDARRVTGARAEAGLGRIRVFAPCGFPTCRYAGSVQAPLEYAVTAQKLGDLRQWALQIESHAAVVPGQPVRPLASQERTLASVGHATWPAFEVLVEPAPAPVAEGAIGGSLLSP